jgi:CheY-like chemotaxis protein
MRRAEEAAEAANRAREQIGDITVTSQLGQGSVFRFSIPVERGSARSVPPSPSRGRVIGLVSGSLAPRVLIVDDDPYNRGWLSALLASIGFEVREADCGREAIRLSCQWNPQLILMDIHMPGMDGLETTRSIRASRMGEQPIVIALKASVMDADRAAIHQSGIDDYLAKPCRDSDVLDKLQAHLKVEYLLAADPTPRQADAPAAKPQFTPAQLPRELTGALQQAVLFGDKERLDTLIHEVRELDTQSASLLQQLADNYDYDALTRMLEEVPA